MSKSIKEAKSKGLFIHSYKPSYIYINDSIEFNILSAWCEQRIWYSNLDEKGKIIQEPKIEKYHLIIKLQENLDSEMVGYPDNWQIKNMKFISNKKGNYLFAYKEFLISNSPLSKDSLKIELEYSIPSKIDGEFNEVKTLGSFYLYGN